jgi:hypothetical protein
VKRFGEGDKDVGPAVQDPDRHIDLRDSRKWIQKWIGPADGREHLLDEAEGRIAVGRTSIERDKEVEEGAAPPRDLLPQGSFEWIVPRIRSRELQISGRRRQGVQCRCNLFSRGSREEGEAVRADHPPRIRVWFLPEELPLPSVFSREGESEDPF